MYQIRLKYLIKKLDCKDLLEYHLDQHGYFVSAELQRHNLKLVKMKYNRIVSRESIYVFFKVKPKQTLKHSIKLGCKKYICQEER